MTGILFGSMFIILSIVLAPMDMISAIVCLLGALLCILITWIELS